MTRSHKIRKNNLEKKRNKNYKLLVIPLILIISVILLTAKNSLKNKSNAIETPSESATSSSVEFNGQPTSTAVAQESPEQEFDRLLAENKPIFAFFHSNNCQKCLDMIDVVNVVYPEFKDRIALVDVNVYDPINQNFLKRANIQAIPTQYFFKSDGSPYQVIGLMDQTDFRDALLTIIGEQ